MTHQSASTVNETPGAAVQQTLHRAFFPTEELYFEVHWISLKHKCKINQEKKESAVVVDTGVEPWRRKTPIPIWECPALYSLEEGGRLGRVLGGRHTFTGLLPSQLHVGWLSVDLNPTREFFTGIFGLSPSSNISALLRASWYLLELNYYSRMEFRERRPTITSDAISTSR